MTNQDIPLLLPRRQRIPASARVSDGMPAEMRAAMESAARNLKGKSGHIYGLTLDGFVQPCLMAAESQDEARRLVGGVVTAFIEIASLDENRITDPFFAAFYRHSAKANHIKAAKSCIRRQGGWEAYKQAMAAAAKKDPELQEGRSPMVSMPGLNIEPKGSEGPRQSVERIASIAKDMLEGQGEVSPLLAVLNGDGRGVAFFLPGGGTKNDINAFIKNAEMAGRSVIPRSQPVCARHRNLGNGQSHGGSPVSVRHATEAVTIVLWDAIENVVGDVSNISIERDPDGRPHAGTIEYSIGEAAPADFSKPPFGALP